MSTRTGSVSQRFCAHWGERTVSGAARKALEAIIPTSSKSATPVDVHIAAKCAGIEQVLEVDGTGFDGLLSVTPSGRYVASLRKGQPLARSRFTLAHEVGHAIIYRSIGSGHALTRGEQLRCSAETADEKDEERLCDVLAAELLMPRQKFLGAIEEFGVCASTIPRIARQFSVSLQAASRRVAQLLAYDVGFGFWMMSETGSHIVPKWYLTKRGGMTLEHAIAVGSTGSECFTVRAVRGWYWVPMHGEMDKYFVDIFPVHAAKTKSWLALVVFGNAAQHILATISSSRPPTASGQLVLEATAMRVGSCSDAAQL